jgi:pimeloyl-ACP methyl ester carboxylesterase
MESHDTAFFTTGDGVRIAYRLDGEPGKPVLVLSNSIATDLHMWDGQAATLAERFRLLRYDARGHGASDVPAAPYSTGLAATSSNCWTRWASNARMRWGYRSAASSRSGWASMHRIA